jgi:hypothetical protein
VVRFPSVVMMASSAMILWRFFLMASRIFFWCRLESSYPRRRRS